MKYIFSADVLHEEPRGQKDKKSDEKYDAKCIKLNNNHIEDAAELTNVMEQIIMQPAAITWIDISFNKLQKIDPVSAVRFAMHAAGSCTHIYITHPKSVSENSALTASMWCPDLLCRTPHSEPEP